MDFKPNFKHYLLQGISHTSNVVTLYFINISKYL